MTTIHYLSTFPGVGKTRWALNHIARRVSQDTVSNIVFYVAPTKALLQQSKEELVRNGVRPSRIHLFSSAFSAPPKKTSAQFLLECTDLDSGPTDPSGEDNQNDPTHTYKIGRLIARAVDGYGDTPPLRPGSIVLLTHEAFIRLPVLKRQETIVVYFDEARKFVLTGQSRLRTLKYSSGSDQDRMRKLLAKYGTAVPHPYNVFPTASNSFLLLKVDDETPPAWIAKAKTKNVEALDQFETIRHLWKQAANPRFDVYLRVLESKVSSTLSVQEILVPSKVFRGFKSVFLLGAYLESSQMFHLLKSDPNLTLSNLFSRLQDSRRMNYLRSEETRMRKRFSHVHIWPLTLDRRKLSAHKYDTGVLVPSVEAKGFASACAQLGMNQEAIRVFTDKLRRKLTTSTPVQFSDAEKTFHQKLVQVGGTTDLFFWYLLRSFDLYKHLTRLGVLTQSPPLLVLNNSHVERATPFLLPEEDLTPDGSFPKRVFKRISAYSHGLNSYRGSNMIVYLAALNPTPDYYALMSVILPEYDPDKDHAAEACIQAVTRTNVREGMKDEFPLEVHVVLPDQELTSLIQEKMEDRCNVHRLDVVLNNSPSMVTIAPYLEAVGSEFAATRRRVAAKVDTNRSEIARQLNSARAYAAQLRKRSSFTDLSDPKHLPTIAKHQELLTRIAELQALRSPAT